MPTYYSGSVSHNGRSGGSTVDTKEVKWASFPDSI